MRHLQITILGLGALLLSTRALAQQPAPQDSVQQRLMVLARPLLLRRPTVVALSPMSVLDSAARYPEELKKSHPDLLRFSTIAERFGFEFILRPPALASIQDERYNAYYAAPVGKEGGFLLFAPGVRPAYLAASIGDSTFARALRDLGFQASRMGYPGSQ